MRTSAEVEAEVEASRDDLDRNVEALKQKMTPGQLFDEAARMMGGAGHEVGARFAEQAKANPMPLAVMGLGLAWLMMSNNRATAGYASPGYVGEPRSFGATPFEEASSHGGAGAELRDKAHMVGEKAHGMVAGVQDRVSGMRSAAADASRSAGEGMSSMAASARDRVSQTGREAQRTFLDALDSEPLLIAGLGLVVGAAIGAALPATRVENRMMGDTRDRMLVRGKELAEVGMEKAGAAAQATYGAVKAELSTDDGRPVEERLGDAARTGVQAGREQLQGPPH